MKNLKLSLFVFALLLSASATSFAQTGVVQASAVFTATATLTPTAVDFGTLPTATAATMTSAGGVAVSTGGTPTAGLITIDGGSAGGTIDLTWNATATLTNAAGDNPVIFTPIVDVTSGGANVTPATEVGSGVDVDHTFGTDTVITIYGGLAASNAAGTFSTSNTNGVALTFTAAYL